MIGFCFQVVNRIGKFPYFTFEDVSLMEAMAVSAGILLRKSKFITTTIKAQRKSHSLMRLVKLANNKSNNMYDSIAEVVKIVYQVCE